MTRTLAWVAFMVALVGCLQRSAVVFLAMLGVSVLILAYLAASDLLRYRRDARDD